MRDARARPPPSSSTGAPRRARSRCRRASTGSPGSCAIGWPNASCCLACAIAASSAACADAERLRRDGDAPAVERPHRDLEPVAEARRAGRRASDPHVTQLEIHAAETAHTQRIRAHHARETWRLEWHEKRADARLSLRSSPGLSRSRRTRWRPRPPPRWRPTLSFRSAHSPPSSSRAVVCWLAASDPACSSDSANAPIASPDRQPPQPSISSARRVPNSAMGSATSELLTLAMTDTTALARAERLQRERVAHVVATGAS